MTCIACRLLQEAYNCLNSLTLPFIAVFERGGEKCYNMAIN